MNARAFGCVTRRNPNRSARPERSSLLRSTQISTPDSSWSTATFSPAWMFAIPTDRSGLVQAFIEKPTKGTAPTNNINAGTYVLEPEVLDLIPGGSAVSIERETFPLLAEREALYAWSFDEYWLDAGTRASFVQANMDVIEMSGGRSIVDPAAVLGEDVEIDHSVVGAGARIERGARIIDSVILPRAVVGPNAWIEGSVIALSRMWGWGPEWPA